MNEETFMWVMQCCVLASGGWTKERMINELKVSESVALAGINLFGYLMDKELKVYA